MKSFRVQLPLMCYRLNSLPDSAAAPSTLTFAGDRSDNLRTTHIAKATMKSAHRDREGPGETREM